MRKHWKHWVIPILAVVALAVLFSIFAFQLETQKAANKDLLLSEGFDIVDADYKPSTITEYVDLDSFSSFLEFAEDNNVTTVFKGISGSSILAGDCYWFMVESHKVRVTVYCVELGAT